MAHARDKPQCGETLLSSLLIILQKFSREREYNIQNSLAQSKSNMSSQTAAIGSPNQKVNAGQRGKISPPNQLGQTQSTWLPTTIQISPRQF